MEVISGINVTSISLTDFFTHKLPLKSTNSWKPGKVFNKNKFFTEIQGLL